MPVKTKATPAQRARARRDPAIFRPPPRPRGDRATVTRGLVLRAGGRSYPVGANVEGDTPWSYGMDQTGTVTVALRDPSQALVAILADEDLLQNAGARITIGGTIYCVSGVDHDGEGLFTLTLEDEVSWRFRGYTSFMSASRKTTTRFGFIYGFVREASRKPQPTMRAFIPEVDDRQPIAKASAAALRRSSAASTGAGGSSGSGTGASEIKVKGKRATARQRTVINEGLTQASKDKASRRVMIGVVMALTQESRAGEELKSSGYLGPLDQSSAWGSEADRKDTAKAVHAFLVTGPSSWKKVHGGLKSAPGDLGAAVDAVQGAGTPGDYEQWKDEAARTVDAWLNSGGETEPTTYVKRYTFTRGERGGQAESSWDAAARLVDEVGAYRWAAFNVFYAVSGDELRRGASALMLRGDEGWLRKGLAWSWASRRSISEMTLDVFADYFDVLPGAIIEVHRSLGAMSGKWMVWNVSGDSLSSPTATVVIRRPTRLKAEPRSETATRSAEGGGDPKTVDRLKAVCQAISDGRSSYVYGGGHGVPLRSLSDKSHFDCSSSVSYALFKAGFMDGSKPALVSGAFASSWGEAGEGDEFTIEANATHVWIQFADGSRFDTSQHSGASGPMYTKVKRTDQGRFTQRHYPGH